MSLKPMGDDAWPEHVAIQELGFHDVFTLVWYYSNLKVDGLHNIETAENPQTRKRNYLQPTYACPGCNQIVLVLFPEVENTKEHQSVLTDRKENKFFFWSYLSDNSLNSLKGQEFHRVIGLQNVSHEARQFIQMRLKAS